MKNLIYLILLSFSAKAFAAEVPQGFEKAYDEAFRLETKTAKISAESLPANSPFRIYLDNYIEFTELFNADSETLFNQVNTNESKRLKLIENTDPKSPYNKFFQAEILIQSAILKLKFGKEAKGVYSIIQAAKLLEANKNEHPSFLPTYKSLGSLHVIIGSVPDNYKWALKILGLKGSINQGFAELNKAGKDKIWGDEAAYSAFFLKTFTARFSEQDNQALLRYVNSRPNDLNAHFLGASVSLRNKKSEQSRRILSQKPVGDNYLELPIFNLHEGDCSLTSGQYQKAISSYNRFLKITKGKAYRKDAYLKLYFAHLLTGETEKAKAVLSKIPTEGSATSDFDKAAQKYHSILVKSSPDKNLIKAKLSLEGGFYTQGGNALKAVDVADLPKEWQTEFYYLNGVSNVHQGNLEVAVKHLEKAVVLAENTGWIALGANAALNLGYAYQIKNKENMAKEYFEKALAYKNHDQKNTVDTKAKTALFEMKVAL